MQSKTLLLTILLVGAGLAGCADAADDSATPTPTATTGATPTNPTPATPTPGGAPLACEAPAATNATPGEILGYPEIVFTVKEPAGEDPCFGFVGPATASAGWTAVTLSNDGHAPHIMPMFRLADNHTWEDYLAAAAQSPPPAWVVPVGGVGFATPGQNGTAIVKLEEGTYVVACFFEGHFMQGMIRPLEVVAAEEPGAPEPEANVTIELRDYNFTTPQNATAGLQIVRFVNNGTEPHEGPLVRLAGNATANDFLAAILNPQGPPPGVGVGGVNMFPPGTEAYAIVDLTAGNYALVCFVESHSHDGAPHVLLGMVGEFTVE